MGADRLDLPSSSAKLDGPAASRLRVELRPWQRKALQRWVEAGYRGIAEVATGGGKTLFGLAAVDEWLRVSPGGVTSVIVPTTALQDQWFVALLNDFGVTEHMVSLWPGQRQIERPFHILVVNTARSVMADLARAHSDLMLIADECHRYASDVNRTALVAAAATLGLSATAEREYDSGYEEVLLPSLGPRIFTYSLESARADGIVSPFALVNVEVDLSNSEREAYEALSRRIARAVAQGDDDRARRLSLQRSLVAKRAAMRIPVTAAVLDRNRGLRTLIFHEDIRAANQILELITSRGHSAAAYHTGVASAIRRDNLRQFRSGWLDTLVCCRALDEGIDVPEAELAIISASTSSQRQRIQRLGRVLRPSSAKALARVVTLYATELEQKRLLLEQARLSDVAQVAWQKAGR